MGDKLKCVFFMNCHTGEYIRHLNSSAKFMEKYSIDIIYTGGATVNDVLSKFREADLIITHNIKNYPGINYTDILTYVKPTCKVIKLEYWRFNGFWPTPSTTGVTGNILYIPNEYGNISYEEYINVKLSPESIQAHFDAECRKFKEIDAGSDISIYDYFIEHYKTISLFSDYAHPTAIIFKYVTEKVLKKLDIDDTIATLKNDYHNNIRVRLILNCVVDELDLQYDVDKFLYLDREINRKLYYEFANKMFNENTYGCSFDVLKPIFFEFLARI